MVAFNLGSGPRSRWHRFPAHDRLLHVPHRAVHRGASSPSKGAFRQLEKLRLLPAITLLAGVDAAFASCCGVCKIDREVPGGVKWLEEYLPPDDYDGYAEVKRRVSTCLLTTGEHEYTRHGYRCGSTVLWRRFCVSVAAMLVWQPFYCT
jgi:hypothetical protein